MVGVLDLRVADSGGGNDSWSTMRTNLAGLSSAWLGVWVAAGVMQIWAAFVEGVVLVVVCKWLAMVDIGSAWFLRANVGDFWAIHPSCFLDLVSVYSGFVFYLFWFKSVFSL